MKFLLFKNWWVLSCRWLFCFCHGSWRVMRKYNIFMRKCCILETQLHWYFFKIYSILIISKINDPIVKSRMNWIWLFSGRMRFRMHSDKVTNFISLFIDNTFLKHNFNFLKKIVRNKRAFVYNFQKLNTFNFSKRSPIYLNFFIC